MTSLKGRLYRMLAMSLLVGTAANLRCRAEDVHTAASVTRIEAKSDTTLAVGLVNDDRMTIHLSRILDNAPIRDAVITVLLRGATHPTVAEADGSYSVQSTDLRLPGSAAVEFHIVQGSVHEDLKGALQVAAGADPPQEKNSARQLGWWVLNFAVCIGFLMLWSRRRKNVTDD